MYQRLIGILLITLIAITSLSCSDNPAEPDQVDPPIEVQVGTATIPPTGGVVKVTTTEDVTVQLTFPPGAVRAETEITLRPLEPQAGQWMSVALEPAGMVFYERIAVTVTFREDQDLIDGKLLLGDIGDAIILPTTPGGSHELSTTLTFFGFTDDGTISVPASPPSNPIPKAGSGNNLGAGPVNCQQLITSVQVAFDAFVAGGQFEEAVTAAVEISALLLSSNCPGVAAWQGQAQQIACAGLTDAMQSAPITQYGDFYIQMKAIIEWAAIVDEVGSTCPASGNVDATIGAKANDLVTFMEPRIAALSGGDYTSMLDLGGEAAQVFQLMAQSAMLGSYDAEDILKENALWPIVDSMRSTAYDLCKSDNWHYPLSRMTSTGFFAARDIVNRPTPRPGIINPAPDTYGDFEDQDIFDDMHMCATCIDVKTMVASGGELASGHMEGTSPGVMVDSVEIITPTRGMISVGGMLAAFKCFDDLEGDDEIIFSFNQTDVLTIRRPISGDNYLDPPAEIDLALAAEASGFVPSEGAITDLTIRRKRSNCDDRLWGDTEHEMVTAKLLWKNPTLELEVAADDTIQSNGSTEISVRVKVIDQLGQAGFFDAIDIALGVTGGSAAIANGTTDSEGYFRTTLTPDATALLRRSGANAAASMNVQVTATSFEGVTEQDNAAITVIPCNAAEGRLREGGSGTHTKSVSYGKLKATANAGPNVYSHASTEWIDYMIITPDDPALIGQRGKVYINVSYKYVASGYSTSRPAARLVIGPRNGFSSPYFFEKSFGTATDGRELLEDREWEIPLSCTFGSASAPMDVNCDVFARAGEEMGCNLSLELAWKGIVKVTTEDGTVVSNYTLCSGSGTNWRVSQ